MEHQVIVFDLAGEQFGLNSEWVKSIIKANPLHGGGRTSDSAQARIRVGDRDLRVIDLRALFALPARHSTQESQIVIVAVEDLTAGLVVDAVSGVLTMPNEAVEPVPNAYGSAYVQYASGVARLYRRPLILVDLAKTLHIQ